MRRLGAWLSLALGQTADLMATATATSSGATEMGLWHTPAAWVAAKTIAVTAAAIVLLLLPKARHLPRVALWLGLFGSTTAVWNILTR